MGPSSLVWVVSVVLSAVLPFVVSGNEDGIPALFLVVIWIGDQLPGSEVLKRRLKAEFLQTMKLIVRYLAVRSKPGLAGFVLAMLAAVVADIVGIISPSLPQALCGLAASGAAFALPPKMTRTIWFYVYVGLHALGVLVYLVLG